MRSASANPFSTSPNTSVSEASASCGNFPSATAAACAAVHLSVCSEGPTNTLPSVRPFGPPGFSESRGSMTNGSGSYSTTIFSIAAAASSSDSAATATMGSPSYRGSLVRATSGATGGRGGAAGAAGAAAPAAAGAAAPAAGAAPAAAGAAAPAAGAAAPAAGRAGAAAGAGGAGGAGMSSAVSTASTPGMASAADVSMRVMRACGRGLSSSLQNSMPSAR